MSEAPLSLAFFDPAHGVHGSARAGMTILFDGESPRALPRGPEVSEHGEGWRASLDEAFDLQFEPLTAPLDLGDASSRVCRVTGTAAGKSLDCLGTATETQSAPEWSGLDALRGVSALFDDGNAVLALARRPRGALGHGSEHVTAWLLSDGEAARVEEARISTVYDGDGRQRSASLELWLPGEDFPRRVAGTVVAGTTLALEGLRVNAAVFSWRMEGREGVGAYDLTARDDPAAA